MGSSIRAAAALVAFFAAIPLCAQAPQQTAEEQYKQLVDSTQLDAKGAQPFHLKIDAQVYALYGRSSSPATIEEWWLAPDQYRIETNSGSFHQVVATGQPNPAAPPDSKQIDARTSYLLDLLRQEIVHPLDQADPSRLVELTDMKVGKADLACLQLNAPSAIQLQGAASTACFAYGTNILRFEIRDLARVVRNAIGTFAGKNVGYTTVIGLAGRNAIVGKVTTLETFDPTASGSPVLQRRAGKSVTAAVTALSGPGGMVPGHLIEKADVKYPPSAREQHISGTVLLRAVINREGKVDSLVVLASPDPLLSDAAINAVRQWRYDPYLLNGQPTETDTTIHVSFNLN